MVPLESIVEQQGSRTQHLLDPSMQRFRCRSRSPVQRRRGASSSSTSRLQQVLADGAEPGATLELPGRPSRWSMNVNVRVAEHEEKTLALLALAERKLLCEREQVTSLVVHQRRGWGASTCSVDGRGIESESRRGFDFKIWYTGHRQRGSPMAPPPTSTPRSRRPGGANSRGSAPPPLERRGHKRHTAEQQSGRAPRELALLEVRRTRASSCARCGAR